MPETIYMVYSVMLDTYIKLSPSGVIKFCTYYIDNYRLKHKYEDEHRVILTYEPKGPGLALF